MMIQWLIDLACLSEKRTILIHWNVRTPNCFDLETWLKEYLDFIPIEQVAMTV